MNANAGYAELAHLGLTFRPLSRGLVGDAEVSPFAAPWATTLDELARELRLLEAKDPVLEVDLRRGQIRNDGLPRADARAASPIVALEVTGSTMGPFRIEAVRFDDWQDNVRAIALGLHDARRMERYGVAPNGRIYAGWKQLAMGSETPSLERGRALAREAGGWKPALVRFHPDGDEPDRIAFESVALFRDHVKAGGS